MARTVRRTPNIFQLPWLFGTPWRKHYKPYWKPNKQFKKDRMALFRAKVKDCMQRGRELPVDKKVDIWNWR